MSRVILKGDRDTDLYVEWSTIVEAPVWIGTRTELLRYLCTNKEAFGAGAPEERLKRADETGTSAMGGFCFFGAWDDGLIVEQRGVLPRGRLAEFARLYMLDESDACYALLEPFEDGA